MLSKPPQIRRTLDPTIDWDTRFNECVRKVNEGRSLGRRARKQWELHNGLIPPGYVIHHIDRDRRNNSIENLQMLTRSDHGKLHQEEDDHLYPRRVVSRHIHRAAYMKTYRKTKTEPHNCGWCGRKYYRDIYGKTKTCSHSCGSHLFWSLKKQLVK